MSPWGHMQPIPLVGRIQSRDSLCMSRGQQSQEWTHLWMLRPKLPSGHGLSFHLTGPRPRIVSKCHNLTQRMRSVKDLSAH